VRLHNTCLHINIKLLTKHKSLHSTDLMTQFNLGNHTETNLDTRCQITNAIIETRTMPKQSFCTPWFTGNGICWV